MDSEHTSPTKRLWTPWRMRYINGDAGEEGCIFCNRLDADNDVESLILHRGLHSFVIMNLYPYNTGHIMLVPNAHAPDPAQLMTDTLHEMSEMLPILTSSLRRVFNCEGFNIGLNIGAIAGAGVADHLHQHVVPRWQGDANFMPVLASTMVIPETIPVTYAKVRAELERQFINASVASFVLLDRSGSHIILKDGRLPAVDLLPDQPVWKSVVAGIPPGVKSLELVGWAGGSVAAHSSSSSIALTLHGEIDQGLPGNWDFLPLDSPHLNAETRSVAERALAQVAPAS